MSYQYYAMDLGEILWLLVVLSLWVLSIICCIKRYEKISTIERAEMISRTKTNTNKTDMPQSNSTNINSSIANSKVNSSNNLIAASNTPNSVMINQNSIIDTNLSNPNTLSINKMNNRAKEFNNAYIPYSSPSRPLYNDIKAGKQYSNNLKNVIVIDETFNDNNMNNVIKNQKYRCEIVTYTKNTQLPHQHAKHNRNLISNQHNKLKHTKLLSTNQLVQLEQNKHKRNMLIDTNNIQSNLSNKKQTNTKITLTKSSSEPALHDLHKNSFQKTHSTITPINSKFSRATSIESTISRFLAKSTSNYSNQFDDSLYKNGKKSASALKTQDSNYLIDPHLIPKIIRKSLLDLHKKSVLNLSQHSSNTNIVNNNTTNVFTQQRHKHQIKMKIKN